MRYATRCSAPRVSATSACTFPTPIRCGRARDSRRFVAAVLEMLSVRKLKVGNADITLLAQTPKVSPYRLEIRRSLAQMLGVTENQVNIKATTTEHLGFIGRNEGLAAQAIVLAANDSPITGGARRWRHRPRGASRSAAACCAPRPKTSKSTKSSVSRREAKARTRCCTCASAARTPNGWRASSRAPRACKPFDVGFAGLKDRNAVTTQHFTVPRGKRAAEEFLGLAGEGYEVLRRGRASAQAAARRARGQPLRDHGARVRLRSGGARGAHRSASPTRRRA